MNEYDRPTGRTASFVAGHRGLVGSAIVRRLERRGFTNILTADPRAARSARPGGRQLLVPCQPAGVRVPRRRHGRRHPRELARARRSSSTTT